MKFSIIIPIYKVEKYLHECVDSILSQTFGDFEVILVDDGSPDGCPQICDEYAHKDARVKVIHQKNAGQASARNAGLKMSRGEYIVYLDSDDYFGDSQTLAKLDKKCVNFVDIVMYGYAKFFESDHSLGEPICNYPQNLKGIKPGQVIRSLLAVDMYDGSAWNKTIRKDLLINNHIEFRTGIISEDSDWFLQVVSVAKIYDVVNESFVIYRQRGDSTSHTPNVKAFTDNLLILEIWTKRLEKAAVPRDLKDELLYVLARYYANTMVLYSFFKEELVKENFSRLKSLKYLLSYSATKRTKLIHFAVMIVGLKTTIMMLRFVGKNKKRI